MNIANTQLVLVLPRASLWVRIPFALLGVGSMLFAVNFAAGGLFGLNFLSGTVHGYCLLGFVCSSSFGSIFLSVWFYESRFLYNRTSNEIIGMTRFICVWWRYRQPLSGATHISVEFRGGGFSGGAWFIWLEFPDGHRDILLQAGERETAAKLAQITGLPLVQNESLG